MGIKEFCPCEAADPAFPDITSLAFVIIYLLAATTISFRKRKPTAFGFASPTPICLCGVCVDLCVFTCAWCTCTHVWRLELRSRRVHHSSLYPLGQGLSVEAAELSIAATLASGLAPEVPLPPLEPGVTGGTPCPPRIHGICVGC